MSFKPLSQSVTNGATAQIPSSDAVFDAIAAIPSPYPSQTGNVNKVLVTDGTSTSWQFAGLGAGSLGANNMVLGKGLPTGLVGANNIIIGQGTTGDSITNQSNAILIGNNSPGGNQDANCIRIGHSTAGTFTNGVTIGNSAVGGGSSVSIGNSASSNNGCVVIGANASSSFSDRTIVIGSFAASAGGGSVNIGSTAFNMETMYLGFGGVAVTSFANFTIMTSRATGTNTSATAGTLTLAGARGTGTGEGGDVIIATAPAGASGSTLNAHVERLRVTASGETRFAGSTSGYVGISSPASPTSYSLVLPSAQASAGMVLANNGSGTLSWQYAGLGSGNFGNNNVILGREKPANLTGTENTIVGYQAGYLVADKTETVSLGWLATATGQGGVALGREATAGLVGTALGRYTEAGTESLAAGHNAKAGGNLATAVGSQSGGTGFYTTSIGYGAKTGSGYNNISIGYVAGYGLTNGADNIFLGPYAGVSVTTGSNNTIIGNAAGTATLSNTIILAAGNTERIRHDATQCTIKTGDLAIETVGKTLKVATGTDAAMGLAVFSGVSTVTVTTAAASGNYYVFLTAQSGSDAFHVENKTTGSFDIVHSGNITADVAWLIVRY